MTTFKLSTLARAAAVCAGVSMSVGMTFAADNGDKAAYEQAKASAKAAYDTDIRTCDSLKDNAKDVCVAEAKATRTRTEETAEARYKNTPKAREHAAHEIADADYKVAKERCDDRTGNEKDVCIKEAKAAMTRAQADAKASQKSAEARIDASKDKREADYQVAVQKCDAMAGDAKNSCIATAKAHYGK